MTCMMTIMEGPKEVKFRDCLIRFRDPEKKVSFGAIDIGTYPHEINLLLTATPGENMIFLQQLRYAVEQAIKHEMER